ncbi:MAG: hypothetical protein C0467_04680 [Planctomycetaceae bacterium]|nr:hypothetical protein [Planctomycetaceae bacterium]
MLACAGLSRTRERMAQAMHTEKRHGVRTTATRLLAILTLLAATAPEAGAQTYTWDANGATAGQTDGAGVWLATGQWWSGTTNVDWSTLTNPYIAFGNGGTGGAVSLASSTTVGSLTFNYFTGTYTLGSINQTITLNNGLTMNPGGGAVTILSPIKLGADQTWTNNTTALMTVNDGTNSVVNTNGFTLTFKGTGTSPGKFNIPRGNGITGSGGIVVDNAYLDLRTGGAQSTNNYTGTTTVQNGGGILKYAQNIGGGNLVLNGGYIDGYFNEGFTRALGTGNNQIQIVGGASGFGTNGSATIDLGGAGAQVTWGSSTFNPSALMLGTPTSSAGTTTFANAINLSGTTRTVFVNSSVNAGAISGIISNSTGTAGLTKTGPGNLILTAANTYNGATSIQGGNIFTGGNPTTMSAAGSITLSGASGSISGTSALNLSNGGTLRLVSTNAQNTVDRMNNAAISVTNGGSISWENTAGANSFAETLGAVTLTSGQFNVVLTTDQTAAGSQTLTLGGLTRNGTSAVTFSAAATGPQASGNKNMIVVSGAGSTTAGQIIGPWATTGTTAALQTDYAIFNGDFVTGAGIAASAQSTWSTIHSATSNYTMSALSAATLNTTRNINTLRSLNNSVTVTASNANITLTGHSLAVGDVVTFSAAAMPTGLTAGTPYFVVATGTNTIQVSATAGGAAITPSTAGTTVVATGGIQLSTGNNLNTTGILNGSATVLNILTAGTGSITLPTSGAGQLHIITGSGSITNNAPIIDNGGALTLVKSGSGGQLANGNNISTFGTLALNGVNTYTGDTIINAGVLRVGTNATANGAKLGGATGIYAGNITINAGAMLHISTDANQTLSGIISGEGTLMKSYSGTLTLNGNNTYTGRTSITPSTTAGAGILLVSSLNSVVGGTASSSLGAPTTVFNGTIDLGGPLSIQGGATLRYIGSGETTDRVVNISYGSNTTRTIDASGSGLLKFTSAFTSTNAAAGAIELIGTGNGEIVQGLPFAVNNLTKSGTGTWTLGGAVGSTGLITVNAGTLALQKRVSLQGGLESNWTAAKINVKSGATLALNVDSSDVNGLSANSLNTLLTNISVAGSATAGLQSGARLGFNTSTATGGTFTQGNAIANSTGVNGGAISVIKLGTGTLIFDKTNTYTGTTTITNGILNTTNAAALSGYNVANKVVINGGTLGVQVGGAGWTTAEVNTMLSNATKTSGAFGIDTTNGSLTQWTAFTTTNLGSTLGLTKLGANTLTLDQANTYAGATTVSTGTLLVNNTTGSGTGTGAVAVNNGGTLGGTGTVGGATTVASGGTIRGGDGTVVGTLNLKNVTINSGGTLATTIGSDGNSSQLALGTNILDLSVGGASTLKLTSITGFDSTVAGTYAIASLTGGGVFRINGVTQTTANNIATYTVGGSATGPVTFDVTGVAGLVAGDAFGLNYDSTTNLVMVNFVPVPEPAAVLGIAIAALGLGQLVRRRKAIRALNADTAVTSV